MSNNKMDNAAYESLWMKELMAFARQSPILHAWEVVGYLDKGQFSRVFKIRHKEKGTLAALKYIPNPVDVSDCAEEGSQPDAFHRSCFEESKHEVKIMNRFHGEKYIAQFLEKPEFHRRIFLNEEGKQVVQYAVLICMPLYRSAKEWMPLAQKEPNVRIQVGLNIARALMLFEKKGVYHRDVKPGNIMLDSDGRFCLSDVGEAKLESDITTLGFHGTRPYMAPEVLQLEGQRTKARSDHRSDIYSLGIVLYKLYNHNQYPFLTESGALTEEAAKSYLKYEKRAKTPGKSNYLTDSERARRLRYEGVRLPPPAQADKRMARIILKACAHSPKDRYQKAVDLYADLRDYAKTYAATVPMFKKDEKRGTGKRIMWLAALLLLLLLLLYGCQAVRNASDAPDDSVTPAVTETVFPTPTANTGSPAAEEPLSPTPGQTDTPTPEPISNPTKKPTSKPTDKPAADPTAAPTSKPTDKPTSAPTPTPTVKPTPTPSPTAKPTRTPAAEPTPTTTSVPSPCPSAPSVYPSEDEVEVFVPAKHTPKPTPSPETPAPSQENSGSSGYFDPYTDMDPTVEDDGDYDEDEVI